MDVGAVVVLVVVDELGGAVSGVVEVAVLVPAQSHLDVVLVGAKVLVVVLVDEDVLVLVAPDDVLVDEDVGDCSAGPQNCTFETSGVFPCSSLGSPPVREGPGELRWRERGVHR